VIVRLLFLMMGAVAVLNGMGAFLLGVIAWHGWSLRQLLSRAIGRHDEREDARARMLDDTHRKVVSAGQAALDEEAQYREGTLRELRAINHATGEIVERLAALAPHKPPANVAASLPELPRLDAQGLTESPADDEEDDDNAKTVVMDKPLMAALVTATVEEHDETTPAEPAVLRASSQPAPPTPARPSQPTLAGIAPPTPRPAMRPPAPPFDPSTALPLEYSGMPITGMSGNSS